MKPLAIRLNFVESGRSPGGIAMIVLACGLLSCALLTARYLELESVTEGLSMRIAEFSSELRPRPIVERDEQKIEAARRIHASLSEPWTGILADLEQANADGDDAVALLMVEPDRNARKVRIVAEAKTLDSALNYVRRLQRSEFLSDPLLENHEVIKDAGEHPVKVQILAAWRTAS